MTPTKIIKLIEKKDNSLYNLSDLEKANIVQNLSFSHLYYLSRLNDFFSIEQFIDYNKLNSFISKNDYLTYLFRENNDFFELDFIFKHLDEDNQKKYCSYIVSDSHRSLIKILNRKEIGESLLNIDFFNLLFNINTYTKAIQFAEDNINFKDDEYIKYLDENLLSLLPFDERVKIKLGFFFCFSEHAKEAQKYIHHINACESFDFNFTNEYYNKEGIEKRYSFFSKNAAFLGNDLSIKNYDYDLKSKIFSYLTDNILKKTEEPLDFIRELVGSIYEKTIPIILHDKLNSSLESSYIKKNIKKV